MRFGDSHARRLASLLGRMQALLVQAQALGLRSTATGELEAAIDQLRTQNGLPRTKPASGALHGLLAELLVLTHELRPQALKSYGELSPEQASFLDGQAARLTELAGKVLDDLELQRKTEVT